MSGKIIAGIASAVVTIGVGIVCAVECHLRKKQKKLQESEKDDSEENDVKEFDVNDYINDVSYKIYELKTDLGLIKEMDPLEIDDHDISIE